MARRLNPIELIVLQGTPFCNLNCSYCDLSPQSRRLRLVMSRPLIERIFTELFTSDLLAPHVQVIWHSGEPLTLPCSYYDQAIEQILRLKQELAGDAVSVTFDIQTNGALVNEKWCAFFKRHQAYLKVGVSCDGPAQMHDAFRRNWSNNATHAKTLNGMELLRAHRIPFKVIAVVTERTLANPEGFLDFFYERADALSGFHFNILAGADGNAPDLSYNPADRQRYYDFYRRILALGAVRGEDSGLVVQNMAQGLERVLRPWNGRYGSRVEEASAPLKSLNFDANGNVTTFYAGLSPDVLPDEYGDGHGLSIGNIMETSLLEMVQSEKLLAMMGDFEASTEFCRRTCEYFDVCTGGFELTKRNVHGTFAAGETTECIIHVKALADALLDDIALHLDASEMLAVE